MMIDELVDFKELFEIEIAERMRACFGSVQQSC